EVNGGLDGVDYDTDSTGNPKVHKVVVTVTKAEDETNALSASITYDGQESLEIKNTFTPADPPLYVTKNFNDWSKADSFTFQIKAITEGAPMPKNLTAKATEKEKTAAFNNIEFWEVGKGTYEYEITEVNDGIDGIAYDTSVHKAAIKVTKANDATNRLHAEALFDGVEAAENDKTGLMITNTFTAAKVVLKVTKDFNDWSKASGFKFDLKAEGTSPMPEDKTGAVAEATKDHRTAAFGEISFDKAGTYRYTVTEENSGISHITYDSTSHTVEVTVIKDEATNALSVASVKYDGEDSLTIKNTYSKPNPNVKPSEKPMPSPKPGPSEKPTPSPKPEPNKDSNRNTNSTSNRTSTTNATPTPAINPVSTTSSKPVQSGDDTQMAGWIIMLIASMSLGFIALEKKKHNNG
ncbi:MAG: VCBS domain-containing protein, partial [Lachnospiraceae bacterium]|nr:VCBS domain-containing protein [Lachnospiraceae bacterium]